MAKGSPKTSDGNHQNDKHAPTVAFHSSSSPKSSITIFINGVRFSSEWVHTQSLFLRDVFSLWASRCPVMEFRRVKMSLNIGETKIPSISPQVLRNCGMWLVWNKWRMEVALSFCASATVYSQSLATWAMGDIRLRRNHEMASKWSLLIWSQNYIVGGSRSLLAPQQIRRSYSWGSVFGDEGSIAKLKSHFPELVIGVNFK